MKWSSLLLAGFALTLLAYEASAKKVTLRCSRGYRVDLRFTLHYPTREPPANLQTFTIACPPDQRIDVPGGYSGIQVLPGDGTMTAPDGTVQSLQIPQPSSGGIAHGPGAGLSPPGSTNQWAPWPPIGYPRFNSYVGSSTHWEVDPYAPPFIQDGELLLGQYDDGSMFPFIVAVIDSETSLPVPGVTVSAVRRDVPASAAISGTTGPDGKERLNLEAGGLYRIQAEMSGYWPQVSDEFLLLGEHRWTMVMTPGAASARGGFYWFSWAAIALLVLILAAFAWRQRRRSP